MFPINPADRQRAAGRQPALHSTMFPINPGRYGQCGAGSAFTFHYVSY